MQRISVMTFTFNKETQTLMEDASSLTGQLDLSRLFRYEAFEVVGKHETKRYCLYDVKREGARNEVGDIQAWMFRPVDNFGRAATGPRLIIVND
jgi:hypothetical protein